MKIFIHTEKCIAAGHCVTAADDIFEQSEDDGVVHLLAKALEPARFAAARDAARRCPTGAIEIIEE